jgi:hypothetical protein
MRASFYCYCGLVVLVELPVPGSAVLPETSQRGVNSKRISLDADSAFYLAVLPVRVLSQDSFIVLGLVWGEPQKSHSSPKESVSCASAVLFLLC